MATNADMETFKHNPLPDASTYIRLLEITSVDETRDVKVHCKLTTWMKAAAPKYTAISYTWGDPTLIVTILINEKRFNVRRNCEDVLRKPCRNKGGYFWIDAICINQADNDEKSFQVANMAKVFEDADQTLACVGRHENDSEFLFEQLLKYRTWISNPSFMFSNYRGLRGIRDRPWEKIGRICTRVRLYKAFSMFLQRPYFHRVWIYQELFFGKKVRVCCEDNSIESFVICGLQAIVSSNWLGFYFEDVQLLSRKSINEIQSVAFLLDAGDMRLVKDDLWATMCVVGALESEDYRDRVFGSLAMIDWKRRKPIQPDYTMDRFDLVVEVLLRLNTMWTFELALRATIKIAHLLGLPDQPSSRLTSEIEARQSKPSEKMCIHPTELELVQKVYSLSLPFSGWFAGARLYFHNDSWHIDFQPSQVFPSQPESKCRSPANLIHNASSLKIQKWSEGHVWDVRNTDIILPQEVQPQDWLLMQSFWGHKYGPQFCTALVARETKCDSPLRVVGKALIRRDVLHWEDMLSDFQLYLDPKDAIVFAHSCRWLDGHGWIQMESEADKDQIADYFGTRVCNEGSYSCAIPKHAS